ncbi:MAG: BatD family protein [Candidatus Pseudobacter hemicellulosilyticus]|uniref:BatD family protein n=1 Tax=Candidatus Pseudobacter hemicellulosilyticus TaxID=3121375 RepID=A0AAJ5WXL5_9BACT|nr:MAG: BatD family protein [Pseudobacter sp.]
MNNRIRHIIFPCLLLLSGYLQAQVLVKASTDRDRILIGEPIRLLLDVRSPLGEPIQWFLLDTLPHFEILEKGKLSSADGVDGKKQQQELTITSYDSGYWQIPPLTLRVGDRNYQTDSLGITVAYTPYDTSADYRDIKAIEEVKAAPRSMRFWILAGITLLVILTAALLLWPRKRKQAEQAAAARVLTPYEEAMETLEALKKAGWQQDGGVKVFYTGLNDALRLFIRRKLGIASLEKTNEELIQALKPLKLQPEQFRHLAEALRMADFVKFARYQPAAADNEQNFEFIKTAITTLNNLT